MLLSTLNADISVPRSDRLLTAEHVTAWVATYLRAAGATPTVLDSNRLSFEFATAPWLIPIAIDQPPPLWGIKEGIVNIAEGTDHFGIEVQARTSHMPLAIGTGVVIVSGLASIASAPVGALVGVCVGLLFVTAPRALSARFLDAFLGQLGRHAIRPPTLNPWLP